MKAIVNARSFVKNADEFESIVGLCALRPQKNWKCWYDDSKNILKIHKNTSMHIYPAKGSVHSTTDIYYKSRPKQIANNSNWMLLSTGTDDFNNESSLVWFIGNDNRLRVCFFVEECWVENHLPLLSGVPVLKIIAKEKNIVELRKVKIPSVLNLKTNESFAAQWPLDNKQMKKLEATNSSVTRVLKMCGI